MRSAVSYGGLRGLRAQISARTARRRQRISGLFIWWKTGEGGEATGQVQARAWSWNGVEGSARIPRQCRNGRSPWGHLDPVRQSRLQSSILRHGRVVRTVQLVSLEMLGPRINLIAAREVAGKAARRSLSARALVWAGPSSAVLGLRRVLGFHGFWVSKCESATPASGNAELIRAQSRAGARKIWKVRQRRAPFRGKRRTLENLGSRSRSLQIGRCSVSSSIIP